MRQAWSPRHPSQQQCLQLALPPCMHTPAAQFSPLPPPHTHMHTPAACSPPPPPPHKHIHTHAHPSFATSFSPAFPSVSLLIPRSSPAPTFATCLLLQGLQPTLRCSGHHVCGPLTLPPPPPAACLLLQGLQPLLRCCGRHVCGSLARSFFMPLCTALVAVLARLQVCVGWG